MTLLDAIQNISLSVVLMGLAAFVVALVVIVFVHEFGHFIVGRWCGVGIETFSVGFGKEIFGFNDKHGTRWKFCILPLGGYVKFEGDANPASVPDPDAVRTPTNLHGKPVLQRIAIVAAGPFANFLLAIAIFALGAMIIGYPYFRPIVSEVIPGSAAAEAGIQVGDEIQSVDGVKTKSFEAVTEAIFMRPGEPLAIILKRGGAPITLTVTPKPVERRDNFGGTVKVGQLGVGHTRQADEPVYEKMGPLSALGHGLERTWSTISLTGQFVKKLFTGQQSVKQVGGPIMIGKFAGDAASNGVAPFIYFIALLSISIGIINLFPIPMLDGGHLVFYAIEAVMGKPLGPVAQEWGYRIGFSCVVMLMLLGLFNDSGRVTNVLFGT